MTENLQFINSHREALGYATFATLTPEQECRHLDAIAQSAPYGNDPWGEPEEEEVGCAEACRRAAKKAEREDAEF